MKSLLILGGTDNADFDQLRKSAQSASRAVASWSTLKDAAEGDEVWFYFPEPVSAVVASGTATADAEPATDWPYVMPVGDLRWLEHPIPLSELRAQFPDWGWTQTARGRTYLSDPIASYLRERGETSAAPTDSAGVSRAPSALALRRNLPPAAAYLLNWNPDTNPDDLTEQEVFECQRFGFVDLLWRCGNARIEPGQRLFLMRTGAGPRGLVGVGRAISFPTEVRDDETDDAGVRCVSFRLTALSLVPLVARAQLEAPPLGAVAWSGQAAAARLSQEQTDALEDLIPFNDDPPLMADEVEEDLDYIEGAVRHVVVNGFERNRAARAACLAHWGERCSVCDLDFAARFGAEFAGLIHVHHLVPLSAVRDEYNVNPVQDLRPVCPNCHAMLHSKRPVPRSIDELRAMVAMTKPRT